MDHIEDADVVIDFRGGKDAARKYRKRIKELKDRLAFADKHIGWLNADKVKLNRSIKLRDNAFDALIKITDKEIEKVKAKNKKLQARLQDARNELNTHAWSDKCQLKVKP